MVRSVLTHHVHLRLSDAEIGTLVRQRSRGLPGRVACIKAAAVCDGPSAGSWWAPVLISARRAGAACVEPSADGAGLHVQGRQPACGRRGVASACAFPSRRCLPGCSPTLR